MARPTAAPGAPGTSVVAAAARGPHVVRRALAAGETWVFAALIIMMAIFTGLAPGKFLTLNDLSLNAQTTAPFLLMAVGETFVIITAGIDLSVGFVLVLSGVVAGEYYLSNGGPDAGAGTIWVGAIFGLAYFSTTTISGHPLDNLVVITAVVIGGASLFGGRGSMLGTFIGVFIPELLATGLIIVGVNQYWQYILTGLVLGAAVYLDQIRRRLRERA